MVDLILEVSCDEEIGFSRWICYELSAAEIRMIFKDKDTGETVEIMFFYDGEFTSFRR